MPLACFLSLEVISRVPGSGIYQEGVATRLHNGDKLAIVLSGCKAPYDSPMRARQLIERLAHLDLNNVDRLGVTLRTCDLDLAANIVEVVPTSKILWFCTYADVRVAHQLRLLCGEDIKCRVPKNFPISSVMGKEIGLWLGTNLPPTDGGEPIVTSTLYAA